MGAGFRIAEAYVEIKSDDTGLRENVRAQTEAAGAGQEIKVKLGIDKAPDMGGLLSNLAPLILPGVAAVGQLTGALGLVPAAAGLAAASVATLAIGTSGVSSAIKAYSTAQLSAGTASSQSAAQQISAANGIINAQESLKSAIQGVGDAQRNAANQIISAKESLANAVLAESNAEQTAAQNVQSALRAEQQAEESLQNAQESALRAQQNLNDARQSAARSLEDLQNRVADTALAQRAAVEQLEKAQDALTAPAKSGQTKDMEALQLAVDQATQHLKEMGLESQRAQEDQAAAAAAGVEGSKQVVAAQDQVKSSQQSLSHAQTSYSDAQQKVTQSQITGQQQIAAAQQKVGDAQRALDNAQISGAEQVARAQDQVSAAQRSLNQALASANAAASTGSSAWSAYNGELAKLAPNAQDFVRSIIGLGPAWDSLKLDVQQRLFAGLGAEVRQIGTADLPILRTGLDSMADSLNLMFRNIGNWATSSKTLADLRIILNNSATAGHNLAGSVQPVLDILRDITAVGSQFLPQLAQHFTDAAKRAADFVNNARDTGKLHDWIQTGIDAVHKLWSIFGDLFDIIKQVSQHQGPVDLLDILKLITGSVRWLVDNMPEIIPIIEGIIAVTKLWKIAQLALNAVTEANPWVALVTAIAIAAYEIYTHWDQIKKFLDETWKWIKSTAESVWTAISNFFTRIWNDIHNTITSVWNAISGFFTTAFNNYRNNLESVWNGISGFFTGVWSTIRDTTTGAWNGISGFFTKVLNDFKGFFSGIWNGIVGDFNNIWGRVTGIAQTVWNNVVGAFQWGVNQVIGLINRLVDGADVVLRFLLVPLIPHVPALAAGGVVGLAGGGTVGAGFTTNGPMAIVGEGNPSHPEYVIPTDPAHRDSAIGLYQSLGARLMAGGGIIDWIGSTVSKVEKWTGAGASGLMNQAIDGLAGAIPQPYHDIATSIGHSAVAAIKAMIDHATAAVGGAFSAAFTGSPNLAGWIQTALGLTGTPGSWAGPLSVLIGRESGGNPNAINRWDSNAAAGHPSQGLMQTILGTFNAYHQAGTSWNILDPVANIAAGINYIKARYGSIFNVRQANPNLPPKGYDAGGLLPTGLSLVRNSSGQPERVLNATQTAKLDRLLTGPGRGQSVTVNVTQTSGSPAETGRFVALALRMVG